MGQLGKVKNLSNVELELGETEHTAADSDDVCMQHLLENSKVSK